VPATELTVMIFPERYCFMIGAGPSFVAYPAREQIAVYPGANPKKKPRRGTPGLRSWTIPFGGLRIVLLNRTTRQCRRFPLRVSAFEHQPGRKQGSKVWTSRIAL
jgi:hypothetical protein